MGGGAPAAASEGGGGSSNSSAVMQCRRAPAAEKLRQAACLKLVELRVGTKGQDQCELPTES